MKFYVYIHRRNDSGEIFYVGKGCLKKGKYQERAHTEGGRNILWKRIVKKSGGFSVEIYSQHRTNRAACATEMGLIKKYGRKDIGTGLLANLTDGGEGTYGWVASAQLRKIRSVNATGKRSAKWVEAIRRSRKNGGNGGVVKRGDKLPEWWCRRISKAVSGKKNHMHGKTGENHPNSRAVINLKTKKKYPSITAAAVAEGMDFRQLHAFLVGYRPNPTSMRLAHAS